MRKDKDKIMFAHVEKWLTSGMSAAAFAKTIGFTKSKFDYWVRKFKVVDAVDNQNIKFIEMPKLMGEQNSSKDIPKEQTILSPQIVLTFPSGMCVKIYG